MLKCMRLLTPYVTKYAAHAYRTKTTVNIKKSYRKLIQRQAVTTARVDVDEGDYRLFPCSNHVVSVALLRGRVARLPYC